MTFQSLPVWLSGWHDCCSGNSETVVKRPVTEHTSDIRFQTIKSLTARVNFCWAFCELGPCPLHYLSRRGVKISVSSSLPGGGIRAAFCRGFWLEQSSNSSLSPCLLRSFSPIISDRLTHSFKLKFDSAMARRPQWTRLWPTALSGHLGK